MRKTIIIILLSLCCTGVFAQQDSDIVFTDVQPVKKHVVIKQQVQPAITPAIWLTFIEGFGGGLAALLMPCIFPMLPLTVGFFTKRQKHGKGKRDALLYGISIIAIYTCLGMLITVLFGASALNRLATNGIFNLCFFLLLVLFSASFLGAFEITLPHQWINKAEGKTGNSFFGIFMMAAVLALVSFSCTGPIIGTLLVQAATTGQQLGPALGMLGFSVALALPFVLFAVFPAWLDKLPKSGGWMNTLKISLGFIELALSLKFLSNVDLAYHWRLFDREVYLVLWIMITGCFGLHLLGKLRLDGTPYESGIGVPRLFTGILIGAFSLYLVPGLWGAPLKAVAAFLPPPETQDFDLYTAKTETKMQVKYANLFQAPLGLPAFFDYREALAYAKKVHKPLLLDFTGHACVNCRKMEQTIWPDQQVLSLIRDKFVLAELYVDDKTPMSDDTTIGDYNSALQASRFGSNSQPDYVLLDPDTEKPLVAPQGANYSAAAFALYLQSGLKNLRQGQDND